MSLSTAQRKIMEALSMTLTKPETVEAAIALLRQKIFETLPKENSVVESQSLASYFQEVYHLIESKISIDFIESLKTKKGFTQQSERLYIEKIKHILDTEKISYTEAGSQQSKDFRNVGGRGLNVETKKTDNGIIFFNDTKPDPSINYIILFTGKKNTKVNIPPKMIGVNGQEFIEDSPWIDEYEYELNQLRDKYARGENKKNLSGIMSVYPRPTYKADCRGLLGII